MTSQVKYNTKKCQNLLSVFVYIFDTKRITYREFEELTGENNTAYSRAMKEFIVMLDKLEMHAALTKTLEPTEEVQIKPECYTLQWVDYDYYYNILNLSDDDLILYSMVITYLLLINNSYVTSGVLENTFPRFTNSIFVSMLDKMKDIIPYDIKKDETQAYYLER